MIAARQFCLGSGLHFRVRSVLSIHLGLIFDLHLGIVVAALLGVERDRGDQYLLANM